ncbi:MAG: hypothetical protein IT369_00330 [Candidatus Latescibacteria bacterium]|nr:hypothetical protein [Candidatus Latescibacterota bacterium]
MRYCWTALLLCVLAQAAGAADAVVTKVRGLSLNVDKGADQGLVAGMEVVVVRLPGEAVIHPITGENLGSPEIRLAAGDVAKVSAGSGVIRLKSLPLMPVHAGDVVRYVATETVGQVAEEQIRVDVARREDAQERQQLKSDVSGLTRDVKNIQTTIHSLENMVQRLEKVDERMRAQMKGISTDVNALKREMAAIRETVATLVSPKVEKRHGESDTLTATQLDRLRQIIQEEITKLRAEMPPPAPETTAVAVHTPAIEEHHPEPETHAEPEAQHEEAPAQEEPPAEEEPPVEEVPFYTTTWFMATVGGIGVLGLGYYLFTFLKGRKGDEEEEEEEEDDEPDAEVEVEEDEEEEDDIVVEESK